MGEVVNSSEGKLFTEKERWICIYPAYINLRKTVAQGRRLPKSKCIENPTVNEIKDVLLASNLNVEIENKMYPREWNRDVLFKGRVRVQIKDPTTGDFINSKFSKKEALLLHLGEMIPRLKSRTQKTTVSSHGEGQAVSQGGTGANPSKNKKKGRKR